MLVAIGEAHLRSGTFPGCAEGLASLRDRMPRYGSIGVADPDGRLVCSSSGTNGPTTIASRAFFRAAVDERSFQIGALITDGVTGRRVLPVALPILAEGRIAAIAIASFDTDWLSANLVAAGALPEGGSVTVADRDGVIVARAPAPERFIGTSIPPDYRHLVTALEAGTVEAVSQDGTRRVLGYVPITLQPYGLYTSAGYATDVAFAAIDTATRRAMALILAGLLSALAAAWVFGRIALRAPVDQLLDAMRRWTAGDRGARAQDEGGAAGGWEIGRLAAGFNAMSEAVATRETALLEGEARLRDVLGQMPVAVVLAEIPSGREIFRNARAEALLPPPGTAATDPLAEPLRRAIEEGIATEGLELPLRRAAGTEGFLSVSAAPVRAAGGQRLAVAAFLDIGARRHAERQQALLTAELRHRVKNALAVVQSVAAQTLAHSETLAQFKQSFSGRLVNLARAQDALFASVDGSVALSALVQATLAPFGDVVSWRGPDVALPSKQTLAMALVLHELATNAAKHGALREGAEGSVAVAWAIEGEKVILTWDEAASQPIQATGRRGFGGRLIERCVAHDLRGEAQQDMRKTGMVWRLSFPRPGLPATIDAAPLVLPG
jgi:two-component sensor histidine kinase